jgi:hypothetical protein
MKGSELQRTRQIGEYLVAAKLMEKGWYATTFTGNVPLFDIVAANDKGETVKVQVKTAKTGSWFLDIKKFVEIRFDSTNRSQEMGEMVKLPFDLYYVFVKIDFEDIMKSKFYVIPAERFQSFLVERYRGWLQSIGGKRSVNPESTHSALWESDIQDFKDNWGILSSVVNYHREVNTEK